MIRRSRLPWAGVLCLLIALGCGAGDDAPSAAKIEAPDFEHTDLDGQAVRLSGLRGRTVVIDFWATWCAPCIYQPAQLNAFLEQNPGDDVVVLGVEVGGASRDEIQRWEEENDAVARYAILMGADEDLAFRFGAMGFPSTVVVDRVGRIASIHLGITSADELEEAIAELEATARLKPPPGHVEDPLWGPSPGFGPGPDSGPGGVSCSRKTPPFGCVAATSARSRPGRSCSTKGTPATSST